MDKKINKKVETKSLRKIKPIEERIKSFIEGREEEFALKLKGFATGQNSSIYKEEMDYLFNIVEGTTFKDDYKIYENPLNVDGNKVKQVGARLRNHNILKGVINLYLGEFDRQPKEYIVTSNNSSYKEMAKDGERAIKLEYIKQALVNQLVENGELSEELAKPQEDIQEQIEKYNDAFQKNRLSIGQDIIDYISSNQGLDEKFIELAYDWFVVGMCASYKDVQHDDVIYEHVPISELIFPLEDTKYFEDRSWAIRKRKVSDSYLIDMFGSNMTQEMFDSLIENRQSNNISTSGGVTATVGKGGVIKTSEPVIPAVSTFVNGKCIKGVVPLSALNTQGRDLYHYQWKEINRVGILTYIDDLGQESKMEVSADYKLNKEYGDISIEYYLENILMEAYSIDNESFFNIKVIDYSRADINNPSIIKLTYNGIKSRSKSNQITSVVKDGQGYQIMINGVHFNLEKLINKSKDKLLVLPYGLIPRKKGMTTKDTMYHVDATSILWVDETSPNAALASQMIKVLDMSLSSYINEAINLIKEIKNEYWEAIGMNPQRFSDINQRAGKATTEQAIIRSSVISNDLFRQLDNIIEKDYNGLLDLSKFAFINGKNAPYIRTDKSIAFIELNEDDAIYHAESNYNVFVKHSSVEADSVEAMKQLALSYLQNGGNMEGASILYSTKSVAKMRDLLNKVDENTRKYQELTQEQEHERNVELENMRAELQKREDELERYKADKNYDAIVDSALIRAEASNNSNSKSETDLEKILALHKMDKENKELDIKEKAVNNKAIQSNQNSKKQ